jgi:uncharacterized protein YdhG (YjbR/CyaY superfamily)
MKTFTMNMHVYCKPAERYEVNAPNVIDGVSYNIYGFDSDNKNGTAIVHVTMKDGFDPVQSFVKDLEEQKRNVTAEFTARLSVIQEQINRFTALEMA